MSNLLVKVVLAMFGVAMGCVLGLLIVVTFIAHAEVVKSDYDTTLSRLSYNSLRLSPGIDFMGDSEGLQAVSQCQKVNIPASGIHVVTSNEMQPFGMSAEDDWTPTMELQPTDPRRPMVTMHGLLLQNATAHIQ